MKRHKLTMVWLSAVLIMVLAVFGCTQQQAIEPATTPTAALAATQVAQEEEEPAAEPEGETDTTGEEVVEEEPMTEEPAAEEEPAEEMDMAGNMLQKVMDRGTLICGINGGLPGFSNLEPDGNYSGMDVEFCHAVAAAIFGDADAVEFRQLSTQERFTALQTGEVDVLFRNTTWTLSRDSEVGLDFGPTIFYDGQGIMVLKELGATTLEDLEGGTICVQSGTTTELNLTDQFRARGIEFEPVVFEEIDPTYTAYDEGRCDAVTSDKSQLLARRTTLQNPEDHEILDVTLSKEPLGPAIAQGDSQWRDVISWVVYSTIQAEEFGISSENVEDFMTSEDPNIQRFMGVEGNLGQMLGLSDDFAVNVVSNVGNYGEIYERNLGPDTPFDLARGPNAQWTDGGLLYSPPFR